MGSRRAGLLLALLALAGCKWNVAQFVAHPPVAERVHLSLSGQLPAPLPPGVNPDSFRFAVFGDPQIAEDGLSYLGRLRQDVAARGIDFVCVLGDLTNDAIKPERESLLAKFDSLGVPCYCTIGNHDLYQADGWQWFQMTFGPSCYCLAAGGRIKLLLLDTAEGLLGQEQFDWLERELDDGGRSLKIVGTHYPVYDGIAPTMWRLASAEERYKLMSLLSEYGVHSFVAGHIHGWRHTVINGVNHFICAMPAAGMDYGKPNYLLFTWAHDSLSWRHVEFETGPDVCQ